MHTLKFLYSTTKKKILKKLFLTKSKEFNKIVLPTPEKFSFWNYLAIAIKIFDAIKYIGKIINDLIYPNAER